MNNIFALNIDSKKPQMDLEKISSDNSKSFKQDFSVKDSKFNKLLLNKQKISEKNSKNMENKKVPNLEDKSNKSDIRVKSDDDTNNSFKSKIELKKHLIDKIVKLLSGNKELLKKLNINNEKEEVFVEKLLKKLEKLNIKNLKTFLFMLESKVNKNFDLNKKEKGKIAVSTDLNEKLDIDSVKDDLFKVKTDKDGNKKVYINKKKVKVVDLRTDTKKNNTPVKSIRSDGKMIDAKKNLDLDVKNLSVSNKDVPSLFENKRTVETKTVRVQNTNDLTKSIVKFAKLVLNDNKSVMKIDLKPDSFGKIFLKIEVVDNKVQVHITTNNEFTGDMLKQNMGDLYNAFKESGLDLQDLNVDVSSGNNKEKFFDDKNSFEYKVFNDDVFWEEPAIVYEDNMLYSYNRIDYKV